MTEPAISSARVYTQMGRDGRAGMVYFSDSSGSYYKNDWHFIEVYITLTPSREGRQSRME